ncbi:MAG: A/G-specific adenine glycosylase [Betaproteobacteria bacterium]|nr:A/G-specific adenine glycosylase [Betaproteobacteria bacterium]
MTARALPLDLASTLIAWQRVHGRHSLPWVGSRDPYRVWLSEIMLQQTQVSTVLGYYERFLQRFPDVASLAAAHQDDVLALWSGLGYYSRARNLHRCAQVVVDQHGGRFPGHSVELATLPGIGRSTAAAIAAFCFDERCAILDGNVKRVLTRALGNSNDLAEGRHERALWQQAEALLPAQDIAAYTQGLMDLGASLCSTRRPACDACPLAGLCVARAEGQPEAYPVKTRKLKRGQREHALLWLDHKDSLWLVQRPQTGVWAGLWSLPEFESDQALWDQASDWPGVGRPMPTVQHALTHFDWTLRPCHWPLPDQLSTAGRSLVENSLPSGRWVVREQALSMGLPAPIRRLLEAGPPQ